MDEMYSVYMVECSDGTLYTGISKDVQRRVKEHNMLKRGARYTRSRRPVKLVWHTAKIPLSMALRAERELKKLSRKEKLKLIKSS